MRRQSISHRVLPTLALLLIGLLPAACSVAGSPTAAPGGSASGPAAESPTGPVAGPSGADGSSGGGSSGGRSAAGCPHGVRSGQVTLSETDNHTAVCLTRGSTLEIYLHARTGEQWSRPTPELPVLQPTANGKGALQIGVTAGFFTAASTGQTQVTAQLVPCRGPKPGPACDVVELFEVTVTVR